MNLKVKFWFFFTAPHFSNFQNLVISSEYSWFLAKNLSNFLSLPWKLHNRKCHTFGHSDPDPSNVRSDFTIFFFQTMSGNETIAYYCLDIFKRAKVTMMNNYTLSILLQTAFTTGYVISAFIMNHVPRRIQFMSSALFMAVSTATLGFTLNQSAEVFIPWLLSSHYQCL